MVYNYDYGYDVAGNLLNNNGITRSYNAVNQLADDGTNSLSYDRMLSVDGESAAKQRRFSLFLTDVKYR